ncbi:FkbM family methyltransferase [uncultured Maricaulis sp.]|uniref:FkbM family methyltransferase n=1 Tax=uncultured Maricaulis sp. TaxID=174710 RepID=UPI0030DB313A|tara:strand:- start:59336 stop:60355 length:1020 start_codon:yes stop_codon:yes gene_type:complete
MSQVAFYATRHGLFAHYESDACIGASLRQYGEWAESEISQIRQYLKSGSFVIDVGANVGTHSVAFAQHVGSEGFVISVEAQPEVHVLLASNIVMNQMQGRVVALNALASSKQNVSPYVASPDKNSENFGAESFTVEREAVVSKRAVMTSLPVIRIDDMNLIRCDLIKIDVEGMELDVLNGSVETIKRHNPIIYFEQNSDRNFAEIHSMLNKIGYKLYWHVSNPFNTSNFQNNTVNIFGGAVELNVLALPTGIEMTTGLPEAQSGKFQPPLPTHAEGLPGEPVPEGEAADVSANLNWVPAKSLETVKAELDALRDDRTEAQNVIEYQQAMIENARRALNP